MGVNAVLQLTDATLVKGGRRILDRLSLTIHEGEHTAIVGPNGSGKSALVNLLTLHDRPLATATGEPSVLVLGQANWNVFELRARLGFVSADLHHRFVGGNSEGHVLAEQAVISGFLASQGIIRYATITEAMRERARSALDHAGIAHLATTPLDAMSSGEARRVLLARALVAAPRLLLLDEPTTGLDLVARHRFMEDVAAVARSGVTLVLVTHHLDEIVPEIGRVVLLQQGRIAADGSKRDVLTPEILSAVFESPVAVEQSNGYFRARPASQRA